jgi:DNA-binding SARP family transcriptional activator
MSAAVASIEVVAREALIRRPRPVLAARLLGRFSVTLDGRAVDTLSSRRTRNVIAYLLAHRRVPVPRDVLMDVFWPKADPDAARNCLHVALTGVRQALRRACAEPIVHRAHDTYRLADTISVWVDVEEFERHCRAGRVAEQSGVLNEAMRCYEAAAQVYDGDFLADDPYADWAAPTRDALRLLAVETQSRLVELYVGRAAFGPAIQVGRWILGVDPCNEPAHRRLMFCYATVGQLHLALSQYRRCADALWDTFGVRPSAQTSRLYEELRGPAYHDALWPNSTSFASRQARVACSSSASRAAVGDWSSIAIAR